MTRQNLHCNVLEVAGTGILIRGPSGSGKSSLTMGLLEHAERSGLDASLVCDDQTFLEPMNRGLRASAPKSIAGKAELRGYGIVELAHKPSAIISLVVEIVDDASIDRMPDEMSCQICECHLPLIRVPARHETAAVRIVFAWLKDRVLDIQN